jgi:hypothetical protein
MHLATSVRVAVSLVALLVVACDREAGTSVGAVPTTNRGGASELTDLDPKLLKPGPVRRETLTDEQMARVRKVKEALKEVEFNPIEVWVDNFKRDVNPDAEIQIWENVAGAYAGYTGGKGLKQEAKEDVFTLLLLRSMMPAEDVLPRLKLKALTEEEAREVMELYPAPAKPVTVIRQ